MLTDAWGCASEDITPSWVRQVRTLGLPCGVHFDAVRASADIAVRVHEILGRWLLNLDDAEPETARLNELFPGHAGIAGLYLVEHEYLSSPAAPFLAPDAITDWSQALEHSES